MAVREQPDPPVGLIRALLKKLPDEVRAEVERRAERRWSVYFAAVAPPNFVARLARRAPQGPTARTSAGRHLHRGADSSRPRQGHRSAFEAALRARDPGSRAWGRSPLRNHPNRRAGQAGQRRRSQQGGRPRDDTALELISFLAVDWALATGERPIAGRSDGTPFGDLAHQVFGWLALPDATGALRRYWREHARQSSQGREVTRGLR